MMMINTVYCIDFRLYVLCCRLAEDRRIQALDVGSLHNITRALQHFTEEVADIVSNELSNCSMDIVLPSLESCCAFLPADPSHKIY